MTWKTQFIFFVCLFLCSFIHSNANSRLSLFVVLTKALTPAAPEGCQLQNVGAMPAYPALLGGCPRALWGRNGPEQQAGGEKMSC